jgi:hypothetical protein
MRAHTILPTKAPMPEVTPIASAPQNVTRMAPGTILAPPVRAASAPKHARNSRDVAETAINRRAEGAEAVTMSGMQAPKEKLAADASAAWIGRASSVAEMPSSSQREIPVGG